MSIQCTPGFFEAVRQNNRARVCRFLNDGIDINAKDDQRQTALYIAVFYELDMMCLLLLEHGANPNVSCQVMYSPLFYAVQTDNYFYTVILLDYGADPNIDGDGELHGFMYSETFEKYLQLFICYGANINRRNELGETMLHQAAASRYPPFDACIKVLLKYGADTTIENNNHKTAYDIAKLMFNKKAAALLKRPRNHLLTEVVETCRICWEEEVDDENTLISPCVCSGSIKHVHVKCLVQWYRSSQRRGWCPTCNAFMRISKELSDEMRLDEESKKNRWECAIQ